MPAFDAPCSIPGNCRVVPPGAVKTRRERCARRRGEPTWHGTCIPPTVDRLLPRSTIVRRRLLRLWPLPVAAVVVTGALLALGPLLTPRVGRDQIRTAAASRGSVESSVSAGGVVVPAREQVLIAPVGALLERVARRPGETVRRGDVVLVLDALALERRLDELRTQAEMEEARRTQTMLEGRMALDALDLEILLGERTIASLGRDLEREQELQELGAVASSGPARILASLEEARLRQEALQRRRWDEALLGQATLRELDLLGATREREIAEVRKTIDRTIVRAGMDGVAAIPLCPGRRAECRPDRAARPPSRRRAAG